MSELRLMKRIQSPAANNNDARLLKLIKSELIRTRNLRRGNLDELLIQEQRQHGLQASLDGLDLAVGYNVLISDATIDSPFTINGQLIGIVRSLVSRSQSREQKARKIYRWVENNIEYGKIGGNEQYIDSSDVLKHKTGICAEMAFLYTAMARSVGLKSNFVSVEIDCYGKSVRHACSSVETERGRILADPAYHQYDARHQKFKIWEDCEITNTFQHLRGK